MKETRFASPVILHIPHASTRIPAEERAAFVLPALEEELRILTDRYTDELFAGRFDSVCFPVSRLVCDPERFRDDRDEPMAAVGMGAVYTHASTGAVLRTLDKQQRERILQTYYDPHHARLTAAVQEKLDRYGRCLLMDCHSFSPTPLPHEPDQAPLRPDFCIGTDAFHTPIGLRDAAVRFLQSHGYSVSLNRPFSGTIVPLPFLCREERVHSLMIEVNRRLYLSGTERNPSFPECRRLLQQLLCFLADADA